MLYQYTDDIDKDFYNTKEDIFEYIAEESKKIKELVQGLMWCRPTNKNPRKV